MGKLVAFIQRVATGKAVLGFFVPTITVYCLMILYTIPQVEQHSSGMKLFDLSPFGYSFEYALKLLGALGVNGRDNYLYSQLPTDFVYPGLFAVFCCLLLSWLFTKSLKVSSRMFYLCFVPVIAGLFDYIENVCIIDMLRSYPNVTESLVAFASVITILKSTFTMVVFVLLIVGVILFRKTKRTTRVQSETGV